MPIPADQITNKRLVIVKQLYQEALRQATTRHTMTARISAIIGFDLANETAVKTIIKALDPNATLKDKLNDLVQQANSALTSANLPPVSNATHLSYVRTQRNAAQHEARYPNETELSDCRTYTRDFLQALISDVWGLSFEQISLADLIQHARIREALIAAEAALSQANYREAAEQAAKAMMWTLQYARNALVGRSFNHLQSTGIVMHDGGGEPRTDRDAFQAVGRMQDTLLRVALGLNTIQHAQYEEIVGYPTTMLNSTISYLGMKNSIDQSEAEFVVVYSIDTILQIENQMGDLEGLMIRGRRRHPR